MQGSLREKDLQNLDKQTLIQMLMMSSQANESLQRSVDSLNQTVKLLTEEVSALRQQRFGRSTEKNLTETEGQLIFAFNEAEGTLEIVQSVTEPTIEEVINPRSYKRRKKKGKREEDLSGIPTEIVRHTLTEEELGEYFPGGKWKKLPDVVYKRLEFHPATFQVIEHHVEVYAGSGADDGKIVKAERPADLFRNSIATPSLVAGAWNFKFINSMPVHRLCAEFDRQEVHIPTQNMCNWLIMAADRYIYRLYRRLHRELSEYHVIHSDETPVKVTRDGRPAGSQSYMWVYRSGALEDHPIVLYDYQKTRKADHPEEFLRDYKGICVTDGYQVYHTLARKKPDFQVAGCWAHLHRKFADVVKTLGREKAKDTIAYKALALIGEISRKEQQYKGLSPQQRLESRQVEVAPLVDAFFAYLNSNAAVVAPKSLTGKAISYGLKQESYLRVFLTDGYVPMDNNAALSECFTYPNLFSNILLNTSRFNKVCG